MTSLSPSWKNSAHSGRVKVKGQEASKPGREGVGVSSKDESLALRCKTREESYSARKGVLAHTVPLLLCLPHSSPGPIFQIHLGLHSHS